MSPRIVTLLVLLAALGCYAAGFALPATLLLVLGVIFELVFWVRLMRPKQQRHTPDSGSDQGA